MTNKLSTNHELFLERMLKSTEDYDQGFDLLLKYPDFVEFFDRLIDLGFFNPDKNPALTKTKNGKYVQVPFWSALNYLESCAKLSGSSGDISLGKKVLRVIRKVSLSKIQPDNYHTNQKFSEILGLVPLSAISDQDISLIPIWLGGKFDSKLIIHDLDIGLLSNLLQSNEASNISKACDVLSFCTEIVWEDDAISGKESGKPESKVDIYWLEKLISNHATTFGSKATKKAADIFLSKLCEIYKSDNGNVNLIHRPAIEKHSQNHNFEDVYNIYVVGLRDSLLAWVDSDSPQAYKYIETILNHKKPIIRRIAIYLINEKWTRLDSIFSKNISPKLFAYEHLHELYNLLQTHFESLPKGDKNSVVDSIKQLTVVTEGVKGQQHLKSIQRNWLSAITNKDCNSADKLFSELNSDGSIGNLGEHPDFHTYSESWVGSGPSPFNINELIQFANENIIIAKLNDFKQQGDWKGPSTSSLVDTLEKAIIDKPASFLKILPSFINADRPYQYGLINGFKRLWENENLKNPKIDWVHTWKELIKFFKEILILDSHFWIEDSVDDNDWAPNRNWIPPLISDFLRSGTKNDKKAYSEELLPESLQLIITLLNNSEKQSKHLDDAMLQAINSPKGKAIEALYSHALRSCRLEDAQIKSHKKAWCEIQSIFDAEIQNCKNGNFEFSTLTGGYLPNIEYMSAKWVEKNIYHIFPETNLENFICAIEGLSYAPISKSLFKTLTKYKVIDKALKLDIKNDNAREKIIERIAIAYLNEYEDLESPIFKYLFKSEKYDDLIIFSNFFSRINNQELNADIEQRIFNFWIKCIDEFELRTSAHEKLLSSLSGLTVYIKKLDSTEIELLKLITPYASSEYRSHDFIEELTRLLPLNPTEICKIYINSLETHLPSYDYQSFIKAFVQDILKHGKKQEAIIITDKLRKLPGMHEIYSDLTAN